MSNNNNRYGNEDLHGRGRGPPQNPGNSRTTNTNNARDGRAQPNTNGWQPQPSQQQPNWTPQQSYNNPPPPSFVNTNAQAIPA